MTHCLKINPIYLDEIVNGEKMFEVRKNDRNFQKDDVLVLQAYDNEKKLYLGKEIEVEVTYVLQEFEGLKDEYVVLGIKTKSSYEEKVKEQIEMIDEEIRNIVQEMKIRVAKREMLTEIKEGLENILGLDN